MSAVAQNPFSFCTECGDDITNRTADLRKKRLGCGNGGNACVFLADKLNEMGNAYVF